MEEQIFTGLSFWTWLIAGVLLMVVELFLPGVFIVWIGLASVISGILFCIFSDLSLSYQLLVFAILSIICVIFGWYIYGQILKKSSKKEYSSLNNGAEAFIGNEYTLIEDVVNGRSKARVGDSVWIVHAPDGLKAGDKIIVGKVDGIVLWAKENNEEADEESEEN